MRDHAKLRAFHLADEMALSIYQATRTFPKEEQYGLTSQIRRAAVSVASNIVEGCARETEADYLRFLDHAYGSVQELGYQLSLAHRLGFLSREAFQELESFQSETARLLNALIQSLRSSTPRSPKPKV